MRTNDACGQLKCELWPYPWHGVSNLQTNLSSSAKRLLYLIAIPKKVRNFISIDLSLIGQGATSYSRPEKYSLSLKYLGLRHLYCTGGKTPLQQTFSTRKQTTTSNLKRGHRPKCRLQWVQLTSFLNGKARWCENLFMVRVWVVLLVGCCFCAIWRNTTTARMF